MRDRILGAMLLVLLFIGSTEAFAANSIFEYGSSVYYLTAEQNEYYASEVCKPHDNEGWTDEQVEDINAAFGLAWCSNYVRLVNKDYHLGWLLFKESSQYLSSMNCECSLHGHADHLGYNTYMELNNLLLAGKEPDPERVKICDGLAVVMSE